MLVCDFHAGALEARRLGHVASSLQRLKLAAPLPESTVLDQISSTWIAQLEALKEDFGVPNEIVLRLFARRSAEVLDDFRPTYVFIWNPFYYSYGVLADLAKSRGIPTGLMEWGLLPASILFGNVLDLTAAETYTTCNRALPDTPDAALDLAAGRHMLQGYANSTIGLYSHKQELMLPENARTDNFPGTILVLACSNWHGGFYPAESEARQRRLPYFTTQMEMAVWIAEKLPHCQVIYKAHPLDPTEHTTHTLPDNLQFSMVDPELLVNMADYVVAAWTKLELSPILRRKILVLPGSGYFWGKACAREASSREELITHLTTPVDATELTAMAEAAALYLGWLARHELFMLDPGTSGDGPDRAEHNAHLISRCLPPSSGFTPPDPVRDGHVFAEELRRQREECDILRRQSEEGWAACRRLEVENRELRRPFMQRLYKRLRG